MSEIRVDQYTMLKLEEYKGTYSLIEGWEGKDGEFKTRWIEEEWGKDKVLKKMPKRVKLGDKDTAEGVLLALLQGISGSEWVNVGKKEAPPANDAPWQNEDVPF